MDELHLLRATRNTTGSVPPAVLSAGREKLMQKAADEESVREPGRVLHPRRPWRRTLFASAAAAALVAALVTVDVVGSGERPGATAEAAQVLNDAAAATITTSDPVLAPGQYLLIDTKAVYSSTTITESGEEFVWSSSQDGQVYVPADQRAEWVWNREPSEPVQFFDEASRREAERQAAQEQIPEETFPFEKQPMRAPEGRFYDSAQLILGTVPLQDGVANAPRDPDKLLNFIYDETKGMGATPDEEAFITIADTLRTGVIPADLRAALYQAAALIPGVTVVDREAALDGRTGIALGMGTHGRDSRIEIIIDPATGQLIGEREILLVDRGSIPAGTAIGWTAVSTSVVDSAP